MRTVNDEMERERLRDLSGVVALLAIKAYQRGPGVLLQRSGHCDLRAKSNPGQTYFRAI
jgi:hypothetical protein